jgi:hypothetical protein
LANTHFVHTKRADTRFTPLVAITGDASLQEGSVTGTPLVLYTHGSVNRLQEKAMPTQATVNNAVLTLFGKRKPRMSYS